jgi:exodeoxyribonuclease V gamma subunit
MLHLHFANRYEDLRDLLLSKLAGQRDDVFAADQVIAPSAAVRREVTLAVADSEGVCANVEFMFLARWLWVQVARVVPGVAAESPFDPAALAWRVYGAFGDADFVAAQPRLANYLQAASGDDVMRYELAVKTAALLEQYVTYRTDWLAQWQAGRTVLSQHALTPTLSQGERESKPPLPLGEGGGEGTSNATAAADERWQAALWQRIAQELGLGAEHPIALLVNELRRGGAERAREAGLPSVVHVFALAAVPPLHIQALQALGRWMQVHVYVVNPCAEYWFDLVDPRQLSRLEAAGQGQGFEVGHRLLASWGKQTQSALALLAGISDAEDAPSSHHYQPNPAATLLAQLQNSILALTELEPASVPLDAADRSIEVHQCHSLTRELEVLHDHLLGLFAADPGLRPSDVLVVTPDLAGAGPLIEAVFGTAPLERRIPFAITGRARNSINAPVRAFMELLALASSRCAASAVFGLLQQPVVARRFDLDEAALLQVHDWILASGIHWGLDGEHVAAFDLPACSAHTFSDGLERLYLGYALPDTVAEPFASLLPSGGTEGSAAIALGAFWRFVQALQELRAAMAQARAAADWVSHLHAVADAFLAPEDAELEDHLELHAVLDELGEAMTRGGLAGLLGAPVVRAALERAFEDPARGGVPTGRVTFASMTSLRSLPFAVVCAIGLNDGAFPTADRPPEFDLMAHAPRLGDRQRRTDQRTLFLDLVLAARASLYLSYVGRSIRDNAPLPPSVLVSELLDVLVPAIATGPSQEHLDAARRRLVVAHPLQPFSPEAFQRDGDERLRSFDAELAQALRESLQARPEACVAPAAMEDVETAEEENGAEDEDTTEPAQLFFTAPLAEPDTEWRQVTVGRLVEFFGNPSRYLLRQCLGLDLPWDEEPLTDDEPFLPSVPARSRLAVRLLPALLAGADLATARRLALAGTEFPAGALGAAEMERELASLVRFAQAVRQAVRDPALPPHQAAVDLAIEGEAWTLEGGFADLRGGGLVRWRYDDERARDVLSAWIRHLLLCAAPPAGLQPVTQSLARDGVRTFAPLEPGEAKDQLAELVALYRRGLREPLHFFPKSSWTFAQSGSYKAAQAWKGSPDFPGESNGAAYRLALRGVDDPLDGQFEMLAQTVFGPVSGRFAPHGPVPEQP